MQKLSEQFNDLSVRAKKTEDVIDAAAAKNRGRLQQQRDALTSAMDSRRAKAGQMAAEAQQDVQAKAQELRSAVDGHFATVRTKAAEHRAEHDRRSAERYADHAEKDAATAVDFALYALDQADYAIIEAAIARADADELAKS